MPKRPHPQIIRKPLQEAWRSKRSVMIVYFILRLSVLLVMVAQAFNGNFENVFLCVLVLILFTIPTFLEQRLSIDLPNTLEIIILLFIYAAEILGEIRAFYVTFPYWDTILHTLNGFLCAAVGFSLHILIIDHFSPGADGVRMSCIQFFTASAVCLVPTLLWEQPTLAALLAAWAPILYAGVLSSGVAYTLQVIGQRDTDPTVASLILSLESVVAALAGWLLLGERLSARELVGCALAFAAIILAQLPERRLAPQAGD